MITNPPQPKIRGGFKHPQSALLTGFAGAPTSFRRAAAVSVAVQSSGGAERAR